MTTLFRDTGHVRYPLTLLGALVLLLGMSTAVVPGAGRAAGPGACTVQVHAGQSIQAALDGAAPGATVCVGPGTYHENLLITTDGITLQGAGPDSTVLAPPAQPVHVCEKLFFPPVDVENTGLNGICVANVDQQGKKRATVHNVRVTGFTVTGFPGVGIVFAYTSGVRADHNVAAKNSGYGITAFVSSHGQFDHNTTYGSHDAGLYIGNSDPADFTVKDNTAYHNLWGILTRDSSTGHITNNMLHDNCSGLVFLNTGTGTGVQNWVVTQNTSTHNDNFCPANEDLPFSLTGLGILIAGGKHIVLRDNTVRDNQPGGHPTTLNGVVLAGGIVVVSTAKVSMFPKYTGSDTADNTIMHNAVTHNQPFDVVSDGLGMGNRFAN